MLPQVKSHRVRKYANTDGIEFLGASFIAGPLSKEI
jgi:hypothetical protein